MWYIGNPLGQTSPIRAALETKNFEKNEKFSKNLLTQREELWYTFKVAADEAAGAP